MLFNSMSFAVFFPIVTAVYFFLPYRFRWIWLLLASCFFYMAFIPAYILILFFTIIVDYIAGICIENSQGPRRKLFLTASIIANAGILGFFKYFNFFNANVASVAHFFDWNYSVKSLSILLPIGLSFHTFQAMAYTIEVYRGKYKAERHLGIYALYVMFYPQLVAGPIERPQNLLPQFYQNHDFDYRRVANGLKLMAWGMFKKIVIADRLALFVNPVYANPVSYHGLPLLLATALFAIQLFCDFSGYSDIAIGAAAVMGFKLMKNFDRPYFSKSVSEFWNRWHISLSSWVRDYLFLPLSLRKSQSRIYLNLVFVFLVLGLWHGADWKFVLFGGLNGLYLAGALLLKKPRERMIRAIGLNRFPRLLSVLQIAVMFSLVSFSFIFFRAASMSDGWYIATHLFTGLNSFSALKAGLLSFLNFPYSSIYLMITLGAVLLMETVHLKQRQGSILELLAKKPAWVRWTVYNGFVLIIFAFGKFDASRFIYFQF